MVKAISLPENQISERGQGELTDTISSRIDTAALAEVFATPEWLVEHLADADMRVIEVDVSRLAYNQGHIPGAILWNAYTDLRHADYSLLNQREFADLLSRSGLTPNVTIVFYGYGASLGFWLMQAYGHKRVLMLNDTRQSWCEAGRPWTTDVPTPMPSTYALPQAEPAQLMSLDAMQSILGSGDPVILDVRSEAEFTGERFWPSGATEGAGRPGHVPGAVHLHIDLLHEADGTLKSEEVMRQLFRDRGVVPERGVVTYCTIGNRASEVAWILKYLLDYPNVRVYYGSWAEWGTRTDTPIV
jgi:thiosulfate/3-mercaptopyruvate sulfurtransferase